MDIIEEYKEEINLKQTSWIQKLNKEELLRIFQAIQLELRDKRLENCRKILREIVINGDLLKHISKSSTKSETMTNYIGKIQPFDGGNFELFHQQLECLLTLNDVPESKQTPLLLTHLTPKVLEILNLLCVPENPIKKSYLELIELLNERYIQSTSSALDRTIFRSRNQKLNESIEDYVIELKKLARRCNFKDYDDQVKEKFIDGILKPALKFELLKNGDLPLEKLIILARTVEIALDQSKLEENFTESILPHRSREMFHNNIRKSSKTPTYSKKITFCKEKLQDKNIRSTMNKSFKNNIICYVCGKNNHLKSDCSLKNKFCSECGQKGHIFKMCRVRHTKNLEVTSGNDIESSIKNLFISDQENETTYSMYSNYSEGDKIPPQLLGIIVEGTYIKFELDTGSEVSTLTLDDQKKLFPYKKIESCNISFKNFDQSISKPIGIVKNLNVLFNNLNKQVDVYIVTNNKPRILGRNWLKIFNLWPLNMNCNKIEYNVKVNDAYNIINVIKEKYMEVFSPGWGNFKGECISLKLKDSAIPKFLPVRQVPFALQDKVKNEIKRLLLNKRIEPVKFSRWGTPVVPILKPDKTVRLCGDYKLTLNKYLETDHYPLPHIETIFQTLRGAEYYCELDLKEAYLQAPLDLNSQELTVINTELGTFKYLYLPYGVSTGPGSFQRLMCNKLKNIPNTIVFIDNIYICGIDYNNMSKTLESVLEILKESEFKLKPEKCKFFRNEIEVFGYKINKYGISIIQENIKPIINLPPPENLTMLRSFLGKITYYSRFLKDMATILTPLYNCTKEGKFKWTQECQNSFNLIKNKLISSQQLKHYDPTLPLILTCDASFSGVSAILSNREANNIVKPIAFASKKLSDRELRYCTLDKEAFAIIFGVTKFYNYIYGRLFELETDNAALVRIFGPNKGIPRMAAKRLQHYAIFLSAFSYKIKYISSDKNPADYLSRITTQIDDNNYDYINKKIEICTNYIESSDIDVLNWVTVQRETKKDLLLCKIIRYCYDGWPDIKLIKDVLKPYYIKRNEISIDRNCLFWGHRIIIPKNVQYDVLNELHKSHFGSTRMIEMAKSYFWWPKVNEDIINLTKKCIICLSYRNTPLKIPLKTWPVPPSPWYRIHADYLGPLCGKMFLIIVDSFSKWPEVFLMSNIGSGLTIEKFKDLFLRFGFPVHLVTDNGTSFTSTEFKNFCNVAAINHTFTPPHHPATNGAAERFVETFKTNVTKIVENGKSLKYAIGIFLSDYRATPHKSTGVSPARLMLGREIRNRFSLLRPTPIYQDLIVKQNKIVDAYKGHRNVNFKVGERVMIRDYRKGQKPWTVGVIIKESVPGVTYYIDVDGLIWKRHVNQMNELRD